MFPSAPSTRTSNLSSKAVSAGADATPSGGPTSVLHASQFPALRAQAQIAERGPRCEIERVGRGEHRGGIRIEVVSHGCPFGPVDEAHSGDLVVDPVQLAVGAAFEDLD